MTSKHTPRVAEAIDQFIVETTDREFAKAWFRAVASEDLAIALYPVFAEVMAQEGFVHPAVWLQSLKEPGR
jgi:hypothetical protein